MAHVHNAYTIEVTAEQDDTPVRGNALASGDAAEDRECENEILSRLDSGDVWAWACVRVTATCEDCDAEGSDTLGACSYANERDFRDDAYFAQMIEQASEECRNMCTCRRPEGTCEVQS
jgi:hypothetical protein